MSSFWRNFHHWLHRKLSFWQLSVQSVIKISSKWQHFRFSELRLSDQQCYCLLIRCGLYYVMTWNLDLWTVEFLVIWGAISYTHVALLQWKHWHHTYGSQGNWISVSFQDLCHCHGKCCSQRNKDYVTNMKSDWWWRQVFLYQNESPFFTGTKKMLTIKMTLNFISLAQQS